MNSTMQSANEHYVGFDPVNRRYIRFDCDAWLKENSIEKEGRTRGKEEQPASDAALPDSIYEKILDVVRQRARDCINEVREHLKKQIASLNALSSDWEQENPEISLNAVIERECNNLDSISSQDISNLEAQRSEFEEAANELKDFRHQNNLDRVAEYPLNDVAHWLWIPVAAIIESFISANLLGGVARGGIIEGWVVAIVLTAANVLIGLGAGFALRQTNQLKTHIKVIYFPLFAICFIVALIWNMTAGHVRDVYMIAESTGNLAAVDQAFEAAVTTMLASPLGWDSLPSAGLAFVGIAVFFLSLYKMYRCDDPFPGYGPRHRKVEELRGSYQDDLNKSLAGLEYRRDQSYSQIDEFKSRHELDQGNWKDIHEEIKSVLDDYVINLKQYNDDLDYLLATYRDANLESRTTPPPAFFNDKFTIGDDLLEMPYIEMPESFEWGNISKVSNEGFNRIEATYKKLRERYAMIDEIVEEQVPAQA